MSNFINHNIFYKLDVRFAEERKGGFKKRDELFKTKPKVFFHKNLENLYKNLEE